MNNIDALLIDLKLMYSATFVPFSKSRNKAPKGGFVPTMSKSLNWKINLSRGPHKLSTDYQQGIAHCPSYNSRPLSASGMLNSDPDAIEFEVENGRHARNPAVKIEAPDIRDVVHSLVSDSSVLDYLTFEAWAADYGYDFDSRSAEKIFDKCRDNSLMLLIMLEQDNLDKLREVFSDY